MLMKRKIRFKILSLSLMFTIFAGFVITGCSDSIKSDISATSPDGEKNMLDTDDHPAETTEIYYAANVPAGMDYNGYAFRILVNEVTRFVWGDVDFVSEELNGEPINDAVYNRNRQTEETLNVVITPIQSSDVSAAVSKTVLSGDDAYDVAFAHTHGASNLAQNKLLVELKNVNTLNMNSAWWDQHSINDLSINNKIFMMTGDIGTMYKKSIGIIMFNKSILADYNFDDPYTLMKNNKWTIDMMTEMGKNVSTDLNGDGTFDDKDMFGLLYFCDLMGLALIGSGVQYCTKDEQDIPRLTFYSEKTLSVFEKFADLLYDPSLSYSWSKVGKTETVTFDMYQNNQALFYYGEFHSAATMRGMVSDFGILPMPLYDSKQESYYHCVNPHVAPMVVLPMTAQDLERTGYVLDVMGAASKNLLTPAYYEITLKGKVTRDNESADTIDIVLNTIRYDIGYLYNWGISGIPLAMADKYSLDLASRYESAEKSIITNMEKTLAAFSD